MDKNSWTLRQLTLLNWGTYDGLQTIDVEPTGEGERMATCIEGVNGSGKTTLTDAYMMLIRPVHAIFNAASNSSGKSQDKRTVLSYMRGEVGDNPKTGKPWLVRESDIIVSAIKGRFASTSGEVLEAAILMCVNCATDTREKKLYATSTDTIDLTMLKDVLPSEFTTLGLRELLGKGVTITENHSKYLEVLSQTFGVSHTWSDFQKLTRLLSMVQGEDAPKKSRINDMFKAYVLPASDVRQRIADARQTIDDNMRSLNDLTSKKTLIETLEPMGGIVTRMTASLEELELLYDATGKVRSVNDKCGETKTEDAPQGAVTPLQLFLTEHKSALVSSRIDSTKSELEAAKDALDEADRAVRKAEREYAHALAAITNNSDTRVQDAKAQLDRDQESLETAKRMLTQAEAELSLAERRLESAKRNCDRAKIQLARDMRTRENARRTTEEYVSRGTRYGLSAWPKTHDAWTNILATISTINTDAETRAQRRVDECSEEIIRLRRDLAEAEEHLAMLRKNKVKLGASYPKLLVARDMIAERMGVSPGELPFLAEIVKVIPGEEQWSLAINACLAPISKRMLIDRSYIARFRKASRDVERALRYRVSYKEVDTDADESCADITPRPGTVASKIEVNWESDYAFSALNLIYENNAICVEDATDFADDDKRYVTRGGHIHTRRSGSIGTNRRDDDILGFVSQTQIEEAESQVEDCQADIQKTVTEQQACKRKLSDIARHRAFADEMHRVSFDDLDLTAHDAIVDASERAVSECERDIESCDADIDAAKRRIDDQAREVESATKVRDESERFLQKMQEETSAAGRTLQKRFDDAREAQSLAHERRGVARTMHDDAKKRLAFFEETKRQLDASDTSALTGTQRSTCAKFVSQDPLSADFEGFTTALNRRCATISSRIESRVDAVEANLDTLAAQFRAHESSLREHSFDNLSGLASQMAKTEQASSELADRSTADPWERPRITWLTHYSHMLDQLRQEWSDIDIVGAKRVCARETMDAVETLLANAKHTETDIARRMRDVNDIMGHIRLGSEDHTLNVAYDFRKKATAAKTHKRLLDIMDLADATRDATATEDELDAVCAATASAAELMKKHEADVMAALDPNEYVNIAFIETRDGHEHKHANLSKLSGGEVQQISACVIGAALLYAMDTEPGDKPCYATIVIDEAFVKADEEHSIATLATLIDMGFAPIVSMPPEGVMKLSPCISKLMAVTKHDMRSRVDAISLDALIAPQQANQ